MRESDMVIQLVVPNRKTTVRKVGKISSEMGNTEETAHSGGFSHGQGKSLSKNIPHTHWE